jgi:YfiR/HmsC-like
MRRARFIVRILLLSLGAVAIWGSARADDPSVPLQLQVELSTKVIEYVQEPPILTLERIRIGIVVKTSSAESMRAGAELKAAFMRLVSVAGRPHEESRVEWSGAKALAEHSRSAGLNVLYFTPGLDAEIGPSAVALTGQRIVTIGAVDSFVPNGVVLGFELVSGHPKMIFNLRQARRQDVVMRTAVMKLMRIVE